MASSTDDALQIINQSYRDVLIQAGKHFRVIAKDGPGALAGTYSGIQAKTGDALTQYHLALNEIENEIIRAKSVLLRDLENLRAARAPAPAPVPTPQLMAPPAPMMELPSAAAHSRSLNHAAAIAVPPPFPPNKEIKTVAPFPDMGVSMSPDVVDLTSGEKTASPRVQAGSVKPVARPAPPANVKPSPKPTHKPTPPTKVTPVPPPQIPRLQAPQPSNASTQAKPQPGPQPPKVHQATQPIQVPAAQAVQDNGMGAMIDLSSTGVGDGAIPTTGGGELNFTDMEFSLAPPPGEPQGAPPAPMSEFDLATFAPQGGNANVAIGNTAGANPMQPSNAGSNMDDLFNLDDTNGAGDNIFDLGGGEVNDSTFEDMMFFGNNDSDMAQFDDAYFGI
ncbi:hypothetical protein F4802DRAFT_583315 [Xylaria palmicola]|nr:hypothetical protein F4802DRAFT_583315 [Xylaria palmicola]